MGLEISVEPIVIIDIAVGEGYGMAKALRIARECKADTKSSDSVANTLSITIGVLDKDIFKCLSRIDGYVSIEPRLMIKLSGIDIYSFLRRAGFELKRVPAHHRLLGYIELEHGLVVLLRTSKDNVYICRYIHTKKFQQPLTPSQYTITGTWNSVFKTLENIVEDLKFFKDKVFSTLREKQL